MGGRGKEVGTYMNMQHTLDDDDDDDDDDVDDTGGGGVEGVRGGRWETEGAMMELKSKYDRMEHNKYNESEHGTNTTSNGGVRAMW